MVDLIRGELGTAGQLAWVGEALTWTWGGGLGARDVRITITPRDDHTRVHLEERMRSVPGRWGGALLGAAAGVFVGMALWLGFGMPQAPPLALFSMICGGVGAFFVSGSIYVQAQVAKERELAALADGMEGLVGAGAPPDGEGPHAAATV